MKKTNLIKQLLDLKSNKNDDDYLIKAESLWKKWMGGNAEKKLNNYYKIIETEYAIDKDFYNVNAEMDRIETPNIEASKFFGKDLYPLGIDKMKIVMFNIYVYDSEAVEWFKENEYFEEEKIDRLQIEIPISTQNRYSDIKDYYFLDRTHDKFTVFSESDEGNTEVCPNIKSEELLWVYWDPGNNDSAVPLLTFDQLVSLLTRVKFKSYSESLKLAMENKTKYDMTVNNSWTTTYRKNIDVLYVIKL